MLGCGKNIVSTGKAGVLKSPGYPAKYKNYAHCKWTVKASRPQNKIILDFFFFHVEGSVKAGGTYQALIGCTH